MSLIPRGCADAWKASGTEASWRTSQAHYQAGNSLQHVGRLRDSGFRFLLLFLYPLLLTMTVNSGDLRFAFFSGAKCWVL